MVRLKALFSSFRGVWPDCLSIGVIFVCGEAKTMEQPKAIWRFRIFFILDSRILQDMSQRERIVQKGKVKSLDVPQTPNKNQLTFGQILANWSKNIWFCKCLNIYLVWLELSNAILISRLLSDGGEFAWYEVGCCDATNPGTSSPVPASDWRCDTFDTPVVESGGGYAQFLDRYIAWYLQLFKVWLSSSNRVSNIIVLLQLIIFSCLWFLTLNKGVWHQIMLVHPFHICLDKNFSVLFPPNGRTTVQCPPDTFLSSFGLKSDGPFPPQEYHYEVTCCGVEAN